MHADYAKVISEHILWRLAVIINEGELVGLIHANHLAVPQTELLTQNPKPPMHTDDLIAVCYDSIYFITVHHSNSRSI